MVSKPFWWIVASRTACFGYPIAPRYFRDFKPTLRGAKSLSWKNTDGERELHHFIILSMKIRHEFMVIWGHLRCFPDNVCFIFQLSSWLVGTWHSAFMFFLRRWSRLRKDRRWMRWSSLWYLNECNPLPFKPEVRLVHLQDARVLKCFHVFSIYTSLYFIYIFIILFKIWILRPNFILTVLCAFHLRWLCNVGLCSRLKNRNLHFPNGELLDPTKFKRHLFRRLLPDPLESFWHPWPRASPTTASGSKNEVDLQCMWNYEFWNLDHCAM